MELPKNITQIGESDPKCKIYVEDYVISYIKQLNLPAQDKDMAVALYGTRKEEKDISYIFLYGACKLDFLQRESRHLSQAQQQEIYLPEAVGATLDYTAQTASYVAQLIQPAHTMEVLDQSSSIVGISAMASEAASTGPFTLMVFAAAVSMSLGFMNLLPIPPFDGGKILIEVIQLVLRRPLSARTQGWLSYLGLAFILFVFVVVLRNDIVRFVF